MGGVNIKKLVSFGTLLGVSPCTLLLYCKDMYDIAYLLSRLTRIGFSREQFSLECAYYSKLLSDIQPEYDTPAARRAGAKVKRGLVISEEEQKLLNESDKKFIGGVSWSDGLNSHEYISKNETAIETINKLWRSRYLLSDLQGIVHTDEKVGVSVAQSLVNKLMKCSDAQMPYVLSQSVASVITDFDTLAEIRRFSDEMSSEIVKAGSKKSNVEVNSDWTVLNGISLETDEELAEWRTVRDIITGNGWDTLDGGAIAVSLGELFKCTVLSDRDYEPIRAQELERCGYFFGSASLARYFIEQLRRVVFETESNLGSLNSNSYRTLVSCWLDTSKLLEEQYTEVGEEI